MTNIVFELDFWNIIGELRAFANEEIRSFEKEETKGPPDFWVQYEELADLNIVEDDDGFYNVYAYPIIMCEEDGVKYATTDTSRGITLF